ncbi:MAG: 3',5'-cyclic-AMP phosphodiesterase [Methylovulum sp.]|nr:3',5'-cyclic-AMP phosphodiesterase [Methylovulum sp.]
MTPTTQSLSILQLTDLHLQANPDATLLGVNTAHYFHAVLTKALAEHHAIDLILLTGDLAQDPCPSSYHYLLDSLKALDIPCLCLPGNHDDYALMQKLLTAGLVSCRKQMFLNNWQIISLNSQIPGSPRGRLADRELAFLAACLSDHPEHHALIAVHHHCLPTRSKWMDTMMIENHQALFALINQYPQVKALVCGHIHQAMDITTGSVRVLGTPSTCFQFTPASTHFSVDKTAPAYRLIQLYADGQLGTKVTRLPEPVTGLQLDNEGY